MVIFVYLHKLELKISCMDINKCDSIRLMEAEQPKITTTKKETVQNQDPSVISKKIIEHKKTPKIEEVVKKVQDLYTTLANKYFAENDISRNQIVSFYSDSERLSRELSVVFSGKSEEEVYSTIEKTSELFENNRNLFVEHYQKIFERNDTYHRSEKRSRENPIATEEEYELGAYKEELERQVADAVFALQKKGYKTFQSGFREKDGDRGQFVDMYNKDVNLPEQLVSYMASEGIEISILHLEDRTTINLYPRKDEFITLDQWKKIWDKLAEEMTPAKQENFDNKKNYSIHSNFRARQNVLRSFNGSVT